MTPKPTANHPNRRKLPQSFARNSSCRKQGKVSRLSHVCSCRSRAIPLAIRKLMATAQTKKSKPPKILTSSRQLASHISTMSMILDVGIRMVIGKKTIMHPPTQHSSAPRQDTGLPKSASFHNRALSPMGTDGAVEGALLFGTVL